MISNNPITPETLELRQAACAKIARCPKDTIHHAMLNRELPFSKDAENIRIVKLDDLLAWMRRTQAEAVRS